MLDDYLRVFFDPAKFLLTVGRWLLFQDLMFQASRPTVVDANVELGLLRRGIQRCHRMYLERLR